MPGTWQATANNTVPIGAIDTNTAGRLSWPIGGGGTDVDSGARSSRSPSRPSLAAGPPLRRRRGQPAEVLPREHPGTSFTLRDRTDFALRLPELSLVKGVKQVGAGTVNGANVDHVRVEGGDLVTYRVDVTNNGDADATDARVGRAPDRHQLQRRRAGQHLRRRHLRRGDQAGPLAGRDLAAGATKTLTYQVTVPVGVSPNQTFVNRAGSWSSPT